MLDKPTKTSQIFLLSAPYANPYQGSAPRALFVCSAGLLRSATAAVVAQQLGYNSRSCGSEEYSLIPLSVNLIEWAERIYFVNEYNYLGALATYEPLPEYSEMIKSKARVWDIPDEYDYMSPILRQKITELLT